MNTTPQPIEPEVQLNFYKPVAIAGLTAAFLILVLGSDVSAADWPMYVKYVIGCFAVFTGVVYFTSGYYQAQLRSNYSVRQPRSLKSHVLGFLVSVVFFGLMMKFLLDQEWAQSLYEALAFGLILQAKDWFMRRKPRSSATTEPPGHSV